jgi:acyl-CoA thioesterase-2
MSEQSVNSRLTDILDLEQIEENLYRGENEGGRGRRRLFGGQVLAQSLVAATRTVEDGPPCHSLHAYFLRPGDASVPVVYQVDPIRDGRSFTTRRIVAIQHGEAIFSMDASFQAPEEGLVHQIDMIDLPGPDDLEDDREVAKRLADTSQLSGWATRERPFEMRSAYPADRPRPDDTRNPIWIRFREPVDPSDPLNQYLLAYASDMGLVSTSMLPHRKNVRRTRMQMASLDHALWYHREFRADEWLVYIKETTSAGQSRGFNRGAFYAADGALIASTMQEGLMRVRQ